MYFAWSLRQGARAGVNPWAATGLEWQTASPPPTHNFEVEPAAPEDVYGYDPEAAEPRRAVLLTSSFTVALAVAAAEHDRRRWVARLLWATAALGVVFLGVEGTEYRNEWAEHLSPGAGFALASTPGAELFFLLYFLATGMHAVHLTIGIVLMAAFAAGTEHASG